MIRIIASVLCNFFLRIGLIFAAYEAGIAQRDKRYLEKKQEAIDAANAERLKVLTDREHRDYVRSVFDEGDG